MPVDGRVLFLTATDGVAVEAMGLADEAVPGADLVDTTMSWRERLLQEDETT
ncbi:MAG: hypothetical protein GY835_23195 [bacterium]|nr:hypothetical protein [bacterium]